MTPDEVKQWEKDEIQVAGFKALDRAGQIAALCEEHGCEQDERRRHNRLYIHESWNPHPSARFVKWWENLGWKITEEQTQRGWSYLGKDSRHYPINTTTAYNCDAVRAVYETYIRATRQEIEELKTGKRSHAPVPSQPELGRSEENGETDEEGIAF